MTKVAEDDNASSEDGQRTATLIRLRHADCLVTLGQAASRMAHDVGTPLAVIAGRSSMIASGQLSGDDAKRSGAIIAEQAERIREVLQRLIELTRWQSGIAEKRSVDQLVAEALLLLRPLANARKVRIELLPSEAGALRVRADSHQVLQVLTNLITYAIDEAPPQSLVQLQVDRFEAHRGLDPRVAPGPHVRVSVSHTPARGEDAKAPQVFDLFHVAQAQYVAAYFGVAISDAIVRGHGGRLTFERTPERGHTSSFHLPLDA